MCVVQYPKGTLYPSERETDRQTDRKGEGERERERERENSELSTLLLKD